MWIAVVVVNVSDAVAVDAVVVTDDAAAFY